MTFQYDLEMPNPNLRAVVGWDPEKNTFFFHITDVSQPAGDRQTLMHVGTRPNEIWSLETLDSTVAQYNQTGMSRDILRALVADSMRGRSNEPVSGPGMRQDRRAEAHGLPWPKPL